MGQKKDQRFYLDHEIVESDVEGASIDLRTGVYKGQYFQADGKIIFPGEEGVVVDDCVVLNLVRNTSITMTTEAWLYATFYILFSTPLRDNDPRQKFVEIIRTSIVEKDGEYQYLKFHEVNLREGRLP